MIPDDVWSPNVLIVVFIAIPIVAYCLYDSRPQNLQQKRHNARIKRERRRNQRQNARAWKRLARRNAKR